MITLTGIMPKQDRKGPVFRVCRRAIPRVYAIMVPWNVQKDRGYVLMIGVLVRPLSEMADGGCGEKPEW